MADKDKMSKDDKKKRQSFKEFDPTKYIETEPTLDEAKNKTIVVSFGRFNPITVGHEKLANKVIAEALKRKADAGIYMSHSQDPKKNPLSYDEKISLGIKAFGRAVKRSKARTLIEVAKELSRSYDNLVVVVGSDRVREFETLMNKYNGREYNFNNIEIVSAGDRDPDADDVSGMSASKMRAIASEGDFDVFKRGLPKKLQSSAKQIYDMVRDGMNINESLNERAPLSIAQRRKRGLLMKRYKSKIRVARERAKRKMAPKEKLLKRSRKRALEFMRNRLMKGKKYSEMSPAEKVALDRRMQKISPKIIDRIAKRMFPKVRAAEKERLKSVLAPKNESINEAFEAFLESRSKKPQDPDVKDMPGSQPKGYYKGVEKDKKDDRARHFKKYSKMNDDNPAAYKPAPGDKEAKTKPSVHTKKFKQMFGEALDEASCADTKVRKRPHMALEKNGSVKIDRRFKMYRPKNTMNEEYEDLAEDLTNLVFDMDSFFMSEEFDNLMESNPKEALKKKAEKTGISYGILKKVFDRGVAAWRTGHRPGTTPTQWGLARVNSFATKGKGTWGKADKDLAAKVRKEDVDIDSFFDLNELNDLQEASMMDKALAAIHKHVVAGKGLGDIAYDVSRAAGVNMSGRELERAYVNKYGKPDDSRKSNPATLSRLKRKYGMKAEGAETAKAKLKISAEKSADARKHDRMLDAAKQRDKAAKERLSRDISEGEKDPKKREWGTDSLTKTYKKDTPGQDMKEGVRDPNISRGDAVRFQYDPIHKEAETLEGTFVGTDEETGRMRIRTSNGKLYKVKHDDIVS